MHDSSIFNIRIDFEKSKGSYIFDKNTGHAYLDFFGLYASLPLGYNHPIFQTKEFLAESSRLASIKIPNCEIISDEAQSFLKEFSGHPSMKHFKYFHFSCTGALAIEAAIKIAIDKKSTSKPCIISLKESFHGINSYGGFVTDRFYPASLRLEGLPDFGWPKIHNPKIVYRNGEIDKQKTDESLAQFLKEFEACIKKFGAENIPAFLVEPIQATYGDSYFPQGFFTKSRELCDKYNICLIFDEIQTGFGATGKMWYFEHFGIIPDIVAFGKKTQVSGVMAKAAYGKTFETPIRLEVTWDGSLLDMVRCKYILQAYKKYNILENAIARGKEIVKGLKELSALKNLRATGLLVAFDFESAVERDDVFKTAVQKRLICNKTRDRSIRLRPNLNLNAKEAQEAVSIFQDIYAHRGVR